MLSNVLLVVYNLPRRIISFLQTPLAQSAHGLRISLPAGLPLLRLIECFCIRFHNKHSRDQQAPTTAIQRPISKPYGKGRNTTKPDGDGSRAAPCEGSGRMSGRRLPFYCRRMSNRKAGWSLTGNLNPSTRKEEWKGKRAKDLSPPVWRIFNRLCRL